MGVHVTHEQAPRARQVHHVKCVQPYFDEAWAGRKTFEIRKDDRDYQPDDILVQLEFDGRFYKHRSVIHIIGYVLRGYPAVKRGYCVFSLLEPDDAAVAEAEAARDV